MTQTIMVGSKSNGSVFAIEGMGLDPLAVRRSAIQFARARYRIADPVVLNDHEAQKRTLKMVEDRRYPKMDVRKLNGNSPMCFDDRYEQPQFE